MLHWFQLHHASRALKHLDLFFTRPTCTGSRNHSPPSVIPSRGRAQARENPLAARARGRTSVMFAPRMRMHTKHHAGVNNVPSSLDFSRRLSVSLTHAHTHTQYLYPHVFSTFLASSLRLLVASSRCRWRTACSCTWIWICFTPPLKCWISPHSAASLSPSAVRSCGACKRIHVCVRS